MLEAHPNLRKRLAFCYVYANIALGVTCLLWCSANWQSHDQLRFLSFLGTAVLASALKVRLPGVTGNVSVLALLVLVGIANLSLSETLVVGAVSMVVQCTWRTQRRPTPVQVLFSICSMATA